VRAAGGQHEHGSARPHDLRIHQRPLSHRLPHEPQGRRRRAEFDSSLPCHAHGPLVRFCQEFLVGPRVLSKSDGTEFNGSLVQCLARVGFDNPETTCLLSGSRHLQQQASALCKHASKITCIAVRWGWCSRRYYAVKCTTYPLCVAAHSGLCLSGQGLVQQDHSCGVY
jgi:hypothetical protein